MLAVSFALLCQFFHPKKEIVRSFSVFSPTINTQILQLQQTVAAVVVPLFNCRLTYQALPLDKNAAEMMIVREQKVPTTVAERHRLELLLQVSAPAETSLPQ